jgi:hypothetical protein
MAKRVKIRRVIIKKEDEQWELHQQFSKLTDYLDRLPDAAEVRRNPPRCAPLSILPMVF